MGVQVYNQALTIQLPDGWFLHYDICNTIDVFVYLESFHIEFYIFYLGTESVFLLVDPQGLGVSWRNASRRISGFTEMMLLHIWT